MTIAIGLIRDVHATPEPLREALAIFRERNVSRVLCAGDIAGYGSALEETVSLLVDNHCESIRGNHEVWLREDEAGESTDPVYRYFVSLPFTRTEAIEGKHPYMVHASPPDSYREGIRLLDERGELMAGSAGSDQA